jgi:hypothetical protein
MHYNYFGISAALCGIPFLFVYPLFLLGYPILLFENANAIDAIRTFNIAKKITVRFRCRSVGRIN